MSAFQTDLKPGTEVIGKWHQKKYCIERLLGEGANGKVYLVSTKSNSIQAKGIQYYALKISFDYIDHQSEVNALQDLEDQRVFASHYLVDVDDMCATDGSHPFYVMRYIQGKQLPVFIQDRGQDWIWVAGKHILQKLVNFHRHGWIFCDLKIENIIVHGHGMIELIDFGGMTRKGRAVKQFTELYDRGYWKLGSRQADEKYDLFAFAILLLQLSDPKYRWKDPALVSQKHRNLAFLKDRIEAHPITRSMSSFLLRALKGEFLTADEALTEWKKGMNENNAPVIDNRDTASQHGLMWLSSLFAASLALFVWTVVMLF